MFSHDERFPRRLALIATCLALILPHGRAETAAPFSIENQGSTSWLAKPDGKKFFSMGVCVVDPGPNREHYNPTNPAYAAFQHYENSNQWAEATLKRLQSWHFTTVG